MQGRFFSEVFVLSDVKEEMTTVMEEEKADIEDLAEQVAQYIAEKQ